MRQTKAFHERAKVWSVQGFRHHASKKFLTYKETTDYARTIVALKCSKRCTPETIIYRERYGCEVGRTIIRL